VVFRTYVSQWLFDGLRHVRPPILKAGPCIPAMSSAATRPRWTPVTSTRWGNHDLPPQAGIAVFERDPDGLLVAVRFYDDVEASVDPS
jgi:hypothetical protein